MRIHINRGFVCACGWTGERKRADWIGAHADVCIYYMPAQIEIYCVSVCVCVLFLPPLSLSLSPRLALCVCVMPFNKIYLIYSLNLSNNTIKCKYLHCELRYAIIIIMSSENVYIGRNCIKWLYVQSACMNACSGVGMCVCV